jgi:hypothetical protein
MRIDEMQMTTSARASKWDFDEVIRTGYAGVVKSAAAMPKR